MPDGHVMETDDDRPGSGEKDTLPFGFSHERPTLEEFLCDVPRFRAREDLSEAVKKLILRDNCIDFYSLKNPA